METVYEASHSANLNRINELTIGVSMLRSAAFFGTASAVSYYLLHVDRMSSLALRLVEIEGMLGISLPPMLGCAALLLFSGSYLRPLFSQSERRQPQMRPRQPQPSLSGAQDTMSASTISASWHDTAIAAAKQIDFPTGARLTFAPSRPTPIHLHLEHAPPERCKRAIALLGKWIASVPTPPRVRISFDGCPEEGSPRHHQVSGALAQHMPRADFKAVSALDAVDVIFIRHDPRWSEFREST